MGHRRGAYLASTDLLLEVIHRDIHPEVPSQINEDDIDAGEDIEECRHLVVIGDLRGEGFTLQAETPDELPCKALPVMLGIGYDVGIEVPCRSPELRRVGNTF